MDMITLRELVTKSGSLFWKQVMTSTISHQEIMVTEQKHLERSLPQSWTIPSSYNSCNETNHALTAIHSHTAVVKNTLNYYEFWFTTIKHYLQLIQLSAT